MFKQRTIKKSASVTGIGLHTGSEVKLTFNPENGNGGIRFIRKDSPGSIEIPADID